MNKSKSVIEHIRLVFPRETCSDYYYATQKEWLETNGIGGYASSTLIGANVRRHHGLLVVPVEEVSRIPHVLLSKLEETVHLDGRNYDLATNQYPFIIFPEGHHNIERFEYNLYPRFIYNLGGVIIQKTLLMLQGENTIVIRYEVQRADQNLSVSIRPLCAFREAGRLTLENPDLDIELKARREHSFILRPYGDLPALHFWYSSGFVEEKFYWYKNTEYRKEQERGKEFSEDLFSPLVLQAALQENDVLDLVVTMDPARVESLGRTGLDELREKEIERRTALVADFPLEYPLAKSLAQTTESFFNDDETRIDLAGGYHWDCDKALDNAIAFSGLTLTLGRYDRAKRLLQAHFLPALQEKEGRLDTVLWYFIAIYNYRLYSEDIEWVVAEAWPLMEKWVGMVLEGRHEGASVRPDGLLILNPVESLTECRAARFGLTVDINALWHNAICIMRHVAKEAHSTKMDLYDKLAAKIRPAFEATFWNESDQCLYDSVRDGHSDPAIRPYQIVTVSLPFDVLGRRKQKSVLDTVTRHLLTPLGLRSLSNSSPGYIGVYAGNSDNRKAAYHRGSVWPWLIGSYIEAYLKTEEFSPMARDHCWKLIEHFREAVHDAGLYSISEIFDGDEPHFPKGRISDSKSVGEVLRAIELLENSERFM